MTLTEPVPLERETLAALRQSDEWVSIRAMWRGHELVESEIAGSKRDARGDSYPNVVWNLPSTLEYGASILREHDVVRAYASVSAPRFSELWTTILQLLRVGDECKLLWSANGHANSLVHAAGLCVDSVSLEAHRKNRRLRFHIDQSTTLPNSARMFTSGEHSSAPIHGPSSHWGTERSNA